MLHSFACCMYHPYIASTYYLFLDVYQVVYLVVDHSFTVGVDYEYDEDPRYNPDSTIKRFFVFYLWYIRKSANFFFSAL